MYVSLLVNTNRSIASKTTLRAAVQASGTSREGPRSFEARSQAPTVVIVFLASETFRIAFTPATVLRTMFVALVWGGGARRRVVGGYGYGDMAYIRGLRFRSVV